MEKPEPIKLSWQAPLENTRTSLDTDKIWVHWGDNKEIRLSAVLEYVLKQIESE